MGQAIRIIGIDPGLRRTGWGVIERDGTRLSHIGLPVAEYAPNVVKKAVVGAGHAEKEQVSRMVRLLLPKSRPESSDAADALAVAICHAHHMAVRLKV